MYSHNFGSNFPDELISVGTKKDVDSGVVELINQYYTYMDNNDIDNANKLYNENKSTLEQYGIRSSDWNRLEEEVYNIGVHAYNGQTIIVSDTEPEFQTTYSSWLKEW